MKCQFCLADIPESNTMCPNCGIDRSMYNYFNKMAFHLVELARENLGNKSLSAELLKHSIILDSDNPEPLKLLGLIFASTGRYSRALHYFSHYNKKEKNDPRIIDYTKILERWRDNLDRYLKVTF